MQYSQMRYDPARKPPVKPLSLQMTLHKYRIDRDNYKCPHCEGEGDHLEEEGSEHLVKCGECYGTGKMTYNFVRDYYFRKFQTYLKEYRDWTVYCDAVSRIRHKLTPRERAFIGMVDTIKGRRKKN